MAFLTPLAFMGAALAVPILLLYMLRLRRREVRVSSNFLWQQTIEDREANTPWQRLRRNLLLLLQLIILALILLALARPFVWVEAVGAGRIALLLDASASMNATDSADGTRFNEAKRRALELVETMGDGDTMTVIRAAEAPSVLQSATSDRVRLRAAIDAAQPSQAAADWAAALTLAAAGAAEADDFTVVIIGDGGIGDAAALPALPADLRYVGVGQGGGNVAIAALAVRALPGAPPQLFARLHNYGAADAEIVFSLRVDDELFAAERYTIAAGADLPIASDALPDGFTTVEAGLTFPADGGANADGVTTGIDLLPTDNTAYTVPAGGAAARVLLMSEGNLFLEQILRVLPGVETTIGDPARGLPSRAFDLIVLDGWLPESLPAGDLLIVNPPRSTERFTVGVEREDTLNPRVDTSDPRLIDVDFDTVNVLRYREVAAAWARPLITVGDAGGALLLAGEIDGREIAILTFDLADSDLPLQIAFPALMSALISGYTPGALVETSNLRAGDSIAVRLPAGAEGVRVTLPDGATRDLAAAPPLTFTETGALGLYRVEALRAGEAIAGEAFAVNLFAPGESAIAPAAELSIGGAVAATAAEREPLGQREGWTIAAALALVMLLIEWLAYHRRQRPPSRIGGARSLGERLSGLRTARVGGVR